MWELVQEGVSIQLLIRRHLRETGESYNFAGSQIELVSDELVEGADDEQNANVIVKTTSM